MIDHGKIVINILIFNKLECDAFMPYSAFYKGISLHIYFKLKHFTVIIDNLYFAEKLFSLYVNWYTYRNSFLLLDNYNKSDRLDYEITGGRKTIEIDEFDYKLLNEISENARIPLIELSDKLACTPQTVNYRLKNLMKLGLIQGLQVGIDSSKFSLK